MAHTFNQTWNPAISHYPLSCRATHCSCAASSRNRSGSYPAHRFWCSRRPYLETVHVCMCAEEKLLSFGLNQYRNCLRHYKMVLLKCACSPSHISGWRACVLCRIPGKLTSYRPCEISRWIPHATFRKQYLLVSPEKQHPAGAGIREYLRCSKEVLSL